MPNNPGSPVEMKNRRNKAAENVPGSALSTTYGQIVTVTRPR